MNRSIDMNCKAARSLFNSALDERFAQPERRPFRAHLLRCVDCRQQFDALRLLQEATHELPSAPLSPDFGERLLERIEAGEGTPQPVLDGPTPIAQRVKLFSSGALTAAALLLSLWLFVDGLGERSSNPEPRTETPNIAGRVVGAPLELPPAAFAQQTLQNHARLVHETYETAPAYVGLPPNNARPKLVERSRDLFWSFKLVNALSSMLEMPRGGRDFRFAENKLQHVMGFEAKPRWSRDDVQKVVAALVKITGDTMNESSQIVIRPFSEPADLNATLSSMWYSSRNVKDFDDFVRKFFGKVQVIRLQRNGNVRLGVQKLMLVPDGDRQQIEVRGIMRLGR